MHSVYPVQLRNVHNKIAVSNYIISKKWSVTKNGSVTIH